MKTCPGKTILLLIITSKWCINGLTLGSLRPEIPRIKVDEVSKIVSQVLDGDVSEESRKIQVQNVSANFKCNYEDQQLVYGELSIPTLATIFDAVGVYENEKFLDIGSGDGALVFATALLYEDIIMSRGVELVPELVERSQTYRLGFPENVDRVEFHCGDIYDCDETLENMLKDTSLIVCFATTWSKGSPSRRLPKLSETLGIHLAPGSRVVIVDGKLDEKDGLRWDGDLKIFCPDTAPYSIASLYEKI